MEIIKRHNVLISQHLRLVFYDFLGHLRAVLSVPPASINHCRSSYFQLSRKSIVKFDPTFENDGHARRRFRNGMTVTKFNFILFSDSVVSRPVSRTCISNGVCAVNLHPRRIMQASASLREFAAVYCRH